MQVIVGHLAVDQHKTPGLQLARQCRKAEFGRVVRAAEHGLAKKQLAHRQTVQAAHQLAVVPYFHRVGVAALVQLQVGVLYTFGDPGAISVGAWRGAGLDDRSEVLVEGDGIALLAQQFAQAAGDMQFVREYHGAWVGRPPENRLAFREPRKAAVAVGLNQSVGRQVATGGEQTIGFAHGLGQRREGKGVALQPGQHGIQAYGGGGGWQVGRLPQGDDYCRACAVGPARICHG